jgi:hypothetical protein
MATILKNGSRGPEVKKLQEALNAKLKPIPKLVPDGQFGGLTHNAVLSFQRKNWLVEDGQAGPATQACLYDTEAFAPILHKVPFIAQPTNTTCWATSTAMMKKSTVPIIIAKTPPDMIASDGGLLNSSESDQAIVTGQRYGRIHGLRCNAPQSWSVEQLRQAVARGPLMFDMLWRVDEYTAGRGSPGHMIVIVGMRGDGNPDGTGTTLRIHDPWPPHRGKIYSKGYFKWSVELPTMTYRVFELL